MIIAEVGLNHLGDKGYAMDYVDAIIDSDVDAATFQVREKEFYCSGKYAHCRLTKDLYKQFSEIMTQHQKAFGVALCDRDEIAFFESIKTRFYKLLYKDLKNDSLVDRLLDTGKLLCVSTGICTVEDIGEFLEKHHVHSKQICLIHTQMSHEISKVNLRAMESLSGTFSLPVGFGNHCSNTNVICMAMAFEPDHVFFYVKGDKAVVHPDSEHAVALRNLKLFSENLKLLPSAMGDGKKVKMNLEIRGMA